MTRTSERSPLASAVIATTDGRGCAAIRCGVEHVAAELHDGDDAAVELEAERRERDRLHVARDLLGVLARVRDDVDFADASARLGDEPGDRDVGEAADLALDLGQIELVQFSRSSTAVFRSPSTGGG